jgi:predicted unusual protein kinase regulating ubiquinone biosynthesis (AarF/ABC1/UbiB family)
MQALLEQLGGAWIKLGQMLALRFDLLPADYCVQFFRLLNDVRPFSTAAVRHTLEHELQRPVEELFRSFDWEPIAAASIGQVHRAELADGTPVAVKIQRPDVRAVIAADLRLMRWIAMLLDALPFVGRLRARKVVEEFARWTEEELDFRLEARHASVLRDNAADDPIEHNPATVSAYTTSRILTLEYLPGIPVIDIITAIRRGDQPFMEALKTRGHDVRRIASHIVWNGLNQIYRFGYFHADPHPANLIVMEHDAIGYVDFGIVGKLDQDATESLRHFAQCLFAGHIGRAVDEFMRFLTPSARTDLAAARADLIDALRSYVESERVGPVDIEAPDGIFEVQMLTVVRKHAMALAPDAVRYLKAVLTADAVVRELDPQFDLRQHENRFFGRLMQLELSETLSAVGVARWLLAVRRRRDERSPSGWSVQDGAGIAARIGPVRGIRFLAAALASWIIAIAAIVASPARGGALQWVGVGFGGAGMFAVLLSIASLRSAIEPRR